MKHRNIEKIRFDPVRFDIPGKFLKIKKFLKIENLIKL